MSNNMLPAFSILEDIGDDAPTKTWKSMYEDNSLMAPTMVMPPYDPGNNFGYDSAGYNITNTPEVSNRYNSFVNFNQNTIDNLKRANMNYTSPEIPPEKINLPFFTPPYQTPYPSNGYSPYDGEIANRTNYVQSIAMPSMPASTPPALYDARNSPSTHLKPQQMSFSLTEGDIKTIIDAGVKEGYNKMKSEGCNHIISHVSGCGLCSSYLMSNEKIYKLVIIILILFILILLFMLSKKKI